VSIQELQSGAGIRSAPLEPGQVWSISPGDGQEHPELYRIEASESPGSGVRILDKSVPEPFRESVSYAEQNVYAIAVWLVGDKNQKQVRIFLFYLISKPIIYLVYVYTHLRYTAYMIKSFSDKDTERKFQSIFVKKFSKEVQSIVRRKLWSIDIAMRTSDLNVPPGNRLEQLKGKRKGRHSIRVNDQWRICFVWNETECIATEVEIVDYH